MEKLTREIPLSIDYLSVILPPSVYVKVVEGLHPHVPKVLEEVLKGASKEQIKEIKIRSEAIIANIKAVEEMIG